MNKNIVIAIVLLVALGAAYWNFNSTPKSSRLDLPDENAPAFRKDGVLSFSNNAAADTAISIDIEVVDEEWSISRGLMYRPSMKENRGMLFIFPDSQPRSFWMKNTIISLDIIFIDSQKNIVTIQKYTTPYSEDSVPSYKDARYVLEVNAGFCDKYNIKEGDRVNFEL